MGWPWSSPRGDIELPNEGSRSPSNPAPELAQRRVAAKPDVMGALRQATSGAKILKDKGLTGSRSPSKGGR